MKIKEGNENGQNAAGKRYIKLSVYALRYGASDEERLGTILRSGAVHAGQKRWPKLTEAERADFLRTVSGTDGFDPSNSRHCSALYGAAIIGLKPEPPGNLLVA